MQKLLSERPYSARVSFQSHHWDPSSSSSTFSSSTSSSSYNDHRTTPTPTPTESKQRPMSKDLFRVALVVDNARRIAMDNHYDDSRDRRISSSLSSSLLGSPSSNSSHNSSRSSSSSSSRCKKITKDSRWESSSASSSLFLPPSPTKRPFASSSLSPQLSSSPSRRSRSSSTSLHMSTSKQVQQQQQGLLCGALKMPTRAPPGSFGTPLMTVGKHSKKKMTNNIKGIKRTQSLPSSPSLSKSQDPLLGREGRLIWAERKMTVNTQNDAQNG